MRLTPSRVSRSGVTLIELAISVAIFSGLTLAILAFVDIMFVGTATTTSRSTSTTAAGQALQRLTEELRESQLLYDEAVLGSLDGDSDVEVFTSLGVTANALAVDLDNAGSRVLSFRLPVDYDRDGDVISPSGLVEWGATTPHPSSPFRSLLEGEIDERTDTHDGVLGETDPADTGVEGGLTGAGDGRASNAFTVTIRFVAVDRWEYDESKTGVDLNGDGQLDDVFEVGHLEKVTRGGPDPAGGADVPEFVEVLTPDVVLQRKGAPVSDIDEDGDPDPLFQLVSPSRLQIKLLCNQRWNGSSTLIEQETSVLLRNE